MSKRLDGKQRIEAIDYAIVLMRRRQFPSLIVQELQRKFNLTKAQGNRLLKSAQEKVAEELKSQHGRDLLAEAYTFWESIISDPDTSLKEKQTAQMRLERLAGLDKVGVQEIFREGVDDVMNLVAKFQTAPPEEIQGETTE